MPSPVILSALAGALTFVAFIAAPSAAAAGEPAAAASASPPDGKMIFEIGCALCHSLNPPAKKAPPISHAASYYLRRHGSEEAAVQAMVAFLQAPSAASSILPAHAIERFGLMPAQDHLSREQLVAVARYAVSMADKEHGQAGAASQH